MFWQVCTIEPSFFKMTSGMHRCPFEGRHLVEWSFSSDGRMHEHEQGVWPFERGTQHSRRQTEVVSNQTEVWNGRPQRNQGKTRGSPGTSGVQ